MDNIVQKIIKRKIALDSTTFMNRDSFVKQISNAVHDVFISVDAEVNAKMLSLYLAWLQGNSTDILNYFEAPYIGFYPPDTWVLSEKIQIQDCDVIPQIDRKYLIMDNSITECSLVLNENLLNEEYLSDVLARLLDLTDAFKVNKLIHSIAYVITRMLKITELTCDVAGEAKYACISSPYKNVGKSTALEIIAYGEGIDDFKGHGFVIAGGDGIMTGMSSKMQQQSFAKTNMVVILNELSMSDQISKSLVQAHDGLKSGSLSTGFVSTKASIIGSSNDVENERLTGRMQIIEFHESSDFNDEDDLVLRNELLPLAVANKGFLVAWCCIHREKWLLNQEGLMVKLHPIIRKALGPLTQRRLSLAFTSNLIVIFMLYASIGKKIDPISVFESILNKTKTNNTKDKTTMDNFAKDICNLIELDDDIFSWLNPTTTFKDTNSKERKAISIRSNALNTFSITVNEIRFFLQPYGAKVLSVNARFCRESSRDLEDLKSAKLCKSGQKCYKFPYDVFSREKLKMILEKCCINYDDDDDDHHDGNDGNNNEEEEEVDLVGIRNIYEEINGIFGENVQLHSTPIRNAVDNFAKNLTPKSSADFRNLGTFAQGIFKRGYEGGIRRRLSTNDVETQISPQKQTNYELEAVEALCSISGKSTSGNSSSTGL